MLLRLVTFHPSTAKTPKSRLWVSRNRLGDGSWGGDVQNAWLVVPTRWSGWWFQIFYFYLTWGNDPFWLIFFKGVGSTTNQLSWFFTMETKRIIRTCSLKSPAHFRKGVKIYPNEFLLATQIPWSPKKTSPKDPNGWLDSHGPNAIVKVKNLMVFPNWGGGEGLQMMKTDPAGNG